MQFLTKRNFLHTARTTQNKNLSALLACVGTLLLPTSLIAGELTQYQASYDILRKGTNHGKAERELKKLDNNNYQVTYHSDIEWMISRELLMVCNEVGYDLFSKICTVF